ncbi:MAG TPA: DUF4129 domain-containing protein [Chloroflexota bacterium]|nr:DUF4129 domain-containing protein [Chloroflexota bacterium]
MAEEDALARLHAILARPEYLADLNRPWWEQLLQPVWDLLTYWLARLAQLVLDASSGREGVYGWLVLAVCTVLIAAVCLYLLRAVRLSLTRDSRSQLVSLTERRERSERLWATAQQLASAGQLGEAVRVLYLSALYALDERALLHIESGLTNREHARALNQLHPDVASTFSDVVERYDRVRYGAASVSETTFAELSALVARSRAVALHGVAV